MSEIVNLEQVVVNRITSATVKLPKRKTLRKEIVKLPIRTEILEKLPNTFNDDFGHDVLGLSESAHLFKEADKESIKFSIVYFDNVPNKIKCEMDYIKLRQSILNSVRIH